MMPKLLSRLSGPTPRFLVAPLIISATFYGAFGHQSAQAQSPPPVEECNQFADVVNRNQAILEAFEVEINNFSRNASQAETLDDIRSAASQYVNAVDDVTANLGILTSDLAEISFADAQLSTYRTDYIDIVSGFNEALSIVSEAMSGVAQSESEAALAANLEAVQTDTVGAVDQIESLAVEESDIIDGVNSYCGAV